MEIKEFTEKVRGAIEKELGDGFRVELKEITKNNGILMQGLLIMAEEGNLVPTIYLDSFYSEYEEGNTLANIVQKILHIYRAETPKGVFNMDFFKDFEKVKGRICYRLINKKQNEELLKDVPYVEFLDLAVCFYYAYHDQEIGDGTILVHNSHMECWKTDIKGLMKCAAVNTPNLLPASLLPMKEVLAGLLPEEEAVDIDDVLTLSVLSNEKKTDGAICMLYPDLLKKYAEERNRNFYIIPSSVHEVLILEDHGEESVEDIKGMIREVNQSHLALAEILSYNLYYYDRELRQVKIL